MLARNSPLARKPVPVLLCLMKLYVREELCVGSLALGEGVDRTSAMERLRRKLDAADPADFAGVVAKWAADHRARWVG